MAVLALVDRQELRLRPHLFQPERARSRIHDVFRRGVHGSCRVSRFHSGDDGEMLVHDGNDEVFVETRLALTDEPNLDPVDAVSL